MKKKNRDIKLVIIKRRKNYFVSEQNSHTAKRFSKYMLAIAMKKAKVLINKPVYEGLSKLDGPFPGHRLRHRCIFRHTFNKIRF